MHLLAISGSLRAGSLNTALLEAAGRVAPRGVSVTLYEGLGALPHFNPDLDTPDGSLLPAGPADLRALIARSDGVLISSPEYAHGIPGSLKNALDWLVGSVEFYGTPVALLSPSARASHATAQLTEVLATMGTRLVAEASVTVPLVSRTLGAADIAADAELSGILRAAVAAFAHAVGERPGA